MLTFLPSVMTARLVLVAATIIANTCSAAFITSNQTTFFNGHDIFIPSGANYIRLNGSQGNEQQYPVYHSTFSPLFYNQTQSSLALSAMAARSFNTARVFLDTGALNRFDGINGDGTTLLSSQYVANIASFLRLAAQHQVYVMITLDQLPQNKLFHAMAAANTSCSQANLAGVNLWYMSPCYIWAKSVFASTLVEQLASQLTNDELSMIFGLSLDNEACYDLTQLPYSEFTGQVIGPDSKLYDMSNLQQRQALGDSWMQHWAETVAQAVHAVNENIPVTVGMFTFQAVGKTGPNGFNYPKVVCHLPEATCHVIPILGNRRSLSF
eukprot:m.46954 g.46954  ORF g.46954 m.46954 type:complete len:324 (+) comp13185_c1_seq4:60-1031(+)